MDIPTRIEIREMSAYWKNQEITEYLDQIKAKYGECVYQDIRFFFNLEYKRGQVGATLLPAGEASVLNEHEQRKAEILADIESRKRLYADAQDTAA